MKVYTKTGDKGTTALVNGERVKKYDIRVEAYGTVDELTAFIALLSDKMNSDKELCDTTAQLTRINSMLMNVEAHLAAGENLQYKLPEISTKSIEELEEAIDDMQSKLPQIMKFTLPGGCELNSLCHICRTICRRAERRAIEASESYAIAPNAVTYLNRLSDYFYLLGRTMASHCKTEELLWVPED